MKHQVDLMLDSGAYSAWKSGAFIDLDEYIEFCLEYEDCIEAIINLDVMPGTKGRKTTAQDVERSASLGWDNLMRMRDAGLNVIPVYHQGESLDWLGRMIDEGFDYIGLSATKYAKAKVQERGLDRIFRFLCGTNGFPCVRTHGFGITNLTFMFNYPWYSVDSTSWVLQGAYGQILLPPVFVDGRPFGLNLKANPVWVRVSNRAGVECFTKSAFNANLLGTKSHDRSLGAFGPEDLEFIEEAVAAEGFDLEELKVDVYARKEFNAHFFRKITEAHEIGPFTKKPEGLFTANPIHGSDVATPGNNHVKVIFAISLAAEHSICLQNQGCRSRLISYEAFKRNNTFDLRQYVRLGIARRDKKSVRLKRARLKE